MQIAKLLFYADKLHLRRYGRPITGDTFIKMEHGPNPSSVYAYLNDVRSRTDLSDGVIQVEEKPNPPHRPIPFVMALHSPDSSVFSETDREVLEEVFSDHGHKSAGQLRNLSHNEKAWREAEFEMAFEDFLDPEDEAMIQYIDRSQGDWAGLGSLHKTG